jgi:hypothetical protein
METIFIYLLKSSALIAVFYLAYHFLVRKETFFNSNRWFLLIGLLTSVVMPLFFFKKVVFVEKPTLSVGDLVAMSQQTQASIQEITPVETMDWFQIGAIIYGVIVAVLLVKIIANLVSLFLLLNKQQIIKREQFALIDLNENVAPFSFFNYIVFNSSLYSYEELQSILLHEKVHSEERHSLDILIARLFCILFWFNPFVWLYKKAITQNLEYIADQKAIQHIADKKAYQKALLKVVSHQNCLSITNNFYQSLIKKRIVMLNKNQSHKRNSWKYAVVLPLLFVFMFYFQVKVVAQEKKEAPTEKNVAKAELVAISIDKNSTDAEMKSDAKLMKEQHGITLNFSKIKRNSKGEITAIRLDYKDKDGKKGTSIVDNGNDPIENITIYRTKNAIEIRSNEKNEVYQTAITNEEVANLIEHTDAVKESTANVENNNDDFPIPPTPPTPPTAPEIVFKTGTPPNFPTPPTAPSGSPITNEKEWKKFEKKMAAFEKKMEAMEPEIEAYTLKMSNIDEQMKPFEKEMEAFEKKMEVFEKQMKVYEEKVELYQKRKQKE